MGNVARSGNKFECIREEKYLLFDTATDSLGCFQHTSIGKSLNSLHNSSCRPLNFVPTSLLVCFIDSLEVPFVFNESMKIELQLIAFKTY